MEKRKIIAVGIGTAALIGTVVAMTIVRKKKTKKEERKEQGTDFVIENWW